MRFAEFNFMLQHLVYVRLKVLHDQTDLAECNSFCILVFWIIEINIVELGLKLAAVLSVQRERIPRRRAGHGPSNRANYID